VTNSNTTTTQRTNKHQKAHNSFTSSFIIMSPNASTTTMTIQQHCDTAIAIVQEQLTAVKSILMAGQQQAEQESLARVVSNLRSEKEQFEKEIAELKATLHDLGNDIAETEEQRQQVLTSAFTTNGGMGGDDSEAANVSYEDDNEENIFLESEDDVAEDDRHDDAIVEDSQETFFEAQDDDAMDTQPAVEIDDEAETAGLEERGIDDGEDVEEVYDAMETQPSVDFGEEEAGASEVEEPDAAGGGDGGHDGMLMVAEQVMLSVDTMNASATSATTNSRRRRSRRVSRVNKSPKKWRRMIRSHRLKSILISN
jgi:hypothetical protein